MVRRGQALFSSLIDLLKDEEERIDKAIPSLLLNPSQRLSRKPSTRLRKHYELIELVHSNPNQLRSLAFLDWASSTIGKFKK